MSSALVWAIVLGLPVFASAQTSTSQEVDEIFATYGDATPGCSVAIDRDDSALHVAGYGMADLEQNVPIREDTAFYAASVSKQFVAMSALLLQQQGKIDLDLPVRTYLPSLPAYADRVTTRHLLQHTSGVRDYFTLFALGNRLDGLVVTEEKIMEMLARQEALNFEPGEKYAYSNSAYFLISQIVKAADGRNLNEFSQAYLFGPLGMGDSRFQHNHRYLVPRKAHGYAPLEDGGYMLADSTLDVVGSGGMYTTVLDLTKWARNFRNNQLEGGVDTIEAMQTVGELNSGEKTDYGLGVGVTQYRGLALRAHGGGLEGYRTYLMMFPEQAFSIAILCNDQKASTGEMARAIAGIYLADDFTEEAPPKEQTPEETDEPSPHAAMAVVDLAQYEASYYSHEVDGTQILAMNEDGLIFEWSPEMLHLEYIADDQFGFSDYGFELVFARDTSGKVTGFTYNGLGAAGVFFKRLGSDEK
ncbi:MAG: beta-lactamase family protein [Proteobacteria bacterium]|nr:beta-lactamase family protein [Pseudomonadota bacterium]